MDFAVIGSRFGHFGTARRAIPPLNTASGSHDSKTYESGAITAEFATALPAVVLLVAVVLAIAAVMGTQLQVSDAARAGARAAALGLDGTAIASVIGQTAGARATHHIAADGPWLTVSVSRSVGLGPLRVHPIQVTGSATSWREP
ncbi:MAG: pilus assembly protein [Promicromonosporaceae bacterium]|nr:pilus assembly protein [Promicromonosporaceae bacterium]